MSNRAVQNGKALSFLIVWSVALGGLFAAVVALSPSAQAAACDQVGGVITGDWTVSNVQVCSGILYTVDGTININSGGSLTLIDGGLSFAKDRSHEGYALNVNAGGALILDNSIVTVQPNAIAPYLKLSLTVSGANSEFSMMDGSILKFPGWFNATGAVLNVTHSTITGFTDSEIGNLGIDTDDNNDAPTMTWSSTSASLFASRIERIYEYTSGPNGTGSNSISLTASSSLYAYDTYISLDYSNIVGWHNTLRVDGTSNAYLYNVTIDRTQDPSANIDWQPAYVPVGAGGSVFLLRWAHVSTVDSTDFPVSGASITSTLSPSAGAAQYPDNGFATTPTQRTLWYLSRTASGATAWTQTGSNGVAIIPLYTDQITNATWPNAESFGNYEEVATFSSQTRSGGAFFPPYPAVNWEDNNVFLRFQFNVQVRTGPDLVLDQADYPGTMSVTQNQPFVVYALIYNRGQMTATTASVGAYLDGVKTNELARANGLTVISFLNQTLNVAGITTTGSHTLELIVDPDNIINEGGVAQEANNFANITLNVLPPPAGFIVILSPENGQTVEPGKTLSVTGYVRDAATNDGILGVPVTIDLRSGSTVYATTTATSDDLGFFVASVTVPSGAADGTYTVVVSPSSGPIQSDSRTITVKATVPFLYSPVPILGLPYWLFLIILAVAVAAAIGVTAYWKVYGLGKMVECGECGAFIPEDATTCPKCGVEFEKDMAKCSNCHAWIPVDVKQCPECGVEFATGELEMADYQEKMRLQYDEVVQKFKQEAGRQLGRSLSESEFQEWWRKQPTFLTFEDWLREEEEMRKMGSKPCPVCGTLNSVTATVCHKCGSLMRDTRPPGGGGGGIPVIPARRGGGPGPSPDAPSGPGGVRAGAPGTEAIPRRVIQKPGAPPPVVQKRVIKKPLEGQEGEGAEDRSSDDSPKDDEL